VEPRIGKNMELQAFSRVAGEVNLSDGTAVGRRTALRADEGDPISVDSGAAIDDRVSLHSTKGSEVQIGKFLGAGDDCVLHGPLKVEERDFVGENAVIFRAGWATACRSARVRSLQARPARAPFWRFRTVPSRPRTRW
jgi:carbon dioxide concentrating mechanism protein CcmM